MGVIFRKYQGIPALTGIAKISLVIFIVSLASACIGTIWAVYIDSFVHNTSYVGFIIASLTFVAFLCYFIFIPLVEKSGKSKLYALSLFITSLVCFLFFLNVSFYIFILLALAYTALTTLRITTMGIIIRDKSTKTNVSRNEGLIYTISNIAWVTGPLIVAFILIKSKERQVFLFASLVILIAFFLFALFKIKDKTKKRKIDKKIAKNFFDFFKDKNRRLAYLIGGGVNFWWAMIYIFIPLFIIRNNLPEQWVAYFLFAVPIPLILFEYAFSKYAGKIGFKKMFKIGFLILAICSLFCFFVSNIYIILALLILAGIGMAMLEPTTEAYFLDISTKENMQRFYGPYNTTIEVNQFLGEILSATLLFFLPFKFIFLMFGIFMFCFFLLSFKIKNIIEKKH